MKIGNMWNYIGLALVAFVLALAVPVSAKAANFIPFPTASAFANITNTASGSYPNAVIPLPGGISAGRGVVIAITYTLGLTNAGAVSYNAISGYDLVSQDGVTRSTTQPILLTNNFTGTLNAFGTGGTVTVFNFISATNIAGCTGIAWDYASTTYTNTVGFAPQLFWQP